MQAKRFTSPSAAGAAGRRGHSGVSAGPSRGAPLPSPFATQSSSRRRRDGSPALNRYPSPETSLRGGALTPVSTPSLRVSRAQSSGNVHVMLSDLVQLSQSIAAYLEHDPQAPQLPHTPSRGVAAGAPGGEREAVALKAQEIERIVKRVQAHYAGKVEHLEKENARLRQLLDGRTDSEHVSRGARSGDASQLSLHVDHSAASREDALRELGRVRVSDGDHSAEATQLRRVLLAEKRQRLLVEEQTQALTEQHAKVVATLERRLKKQEGQLRDLINAVDVSYNGQGSGRVTPATSVAPGSQALPSSLSPSGSGQVTPRRLLRQQLAQHQQTQRALEEYRQQLATESAVGQPIVVAADDDEEELSGLGLGDIQRTLNAIQHSAPPVEHSTQRSQAAAASAGNGVDLPLPAKLPSPSQASTAHSGVDDIGAYLDSISKELETIGIEDDLM